jgi:hypothetical protein
MSWEWNWKTIVGAAIVVLGMLRLPQVLSNSGGGSYGVGQVTGVVLITLAGVWLIRSGLSRVRN